MMDDFREDEEVTLPPEMLPKCPGADVFIETTEGLFRVVPGADKWERVTH